MALRELPGDGPLTTNAGVNRDRAMQMFKAGMTVEQIAAEFPKVFFASEGTLGQKYDSIYVRSGRKETKYMITSEATKKAIAAHKAAKKSAKVTSKGGVKLLTAEQIFKLVQKEGKTRR